MHDIENLQYQDIAFDEFVRARRGFLEVELPAGSGPGYWKNVWPARAYRGPGTHLVHSPPHSALKHLLRRRTSKVAHRFRIDGPQVPLA
ncbi:hypothetical protein, partial [Corynebacterium sp.]|uniref:hypothetical protein n=1 Tax=Corynebacterium sp. TaxID=1720 RepID=UPI002A90BB2C